MMNCFEHKSKSAIGACKYCFKGVCEDCFVAIDSVLCCKNEVCKTNLAEEIAVIERSKDLYMIGKYSKSAPRIGSLSLLYLILGLAFSIIGVVNSYADGKIIFSDFILGIVIIGFALNNIFKKNRLNY